MAASTSTTSASTQTYIPHTDPRLEPSIPHESALTTQIGTCITSLQHQNFALHRHAFRGTHVKTQAIVKGTLEVLPDLPEHLRQGLFAHRGTGPYPVAVRFANEPSLLQDDRAPGPRGCGMRVFNLPEGLEYLDPVVGEKTRTQDFTFNNAPALELRDVTTCAEILSLREKYLVNDKETLEAELRKRKDADVQLAPTSGKLPNHHFLAYTMYSQSAYRFGEYVCKYAIFPTGQHQRSLGETHRISEESDPSQHSIWLSDFFSTTTTTNTAASYDFRIQLLVSPTSQSVEDTSLPWDESLYPFETVARLVFPRGQEVFSAQRRTFWEEKVRLNVWGGLVEHRPMGSVNRLRREVYKLSQGWREEVNGGGELVDVGDVEEIP